MWFCRKVPFPFLSKNVITPPRSDNIPFCEITEAHDWEWLLMALGDCRNPWKVRRERQPLSVNLGISEGVLKSDSRISDGQTITIDGSTGVVTINGGS